jgi:hypothetical protein
MKAIKRERKKRWERGAPVPMQVTARDEAIVRLVVELGFATKTQVADVLFGSTTSSNCQRRLTLLVRNGYLDKLPGRGASEPDVYRVTKRTTKGSLLIGGVEARRRAKGQLEHVLAVNDLHCRMLRACGRRGWVVVEWRTQAELADWAKEGGFVPDAFCQVALRERDREGLSAMLLEVERSPRSTSSIEKKYRLIADFVRSGAYERRTGRRSLRVLVVVYGTDIGQERAWARRLCGLAERAGLSFGWYAGGSDLLQHPSELFAARVWLRPGKPDLWSLDDATVGGGA